MAFSCCFPSVLIAGQRIFFMKEALLKKTLEVAGFKPWTSSAWTDFTNHYSTTAPRILFFVPKLSSLISQEINLIPNKLHWTFETNDYFPGPRSTGRMRRSRRSSEKWTASSCEGPSRLDPGEKIAPSIRWLNRDVAILTKPFLIALNSNWWYVFFLIYTWDLIWNFVNKKSFAGSGIWPNDLPTHVFLPGNSLYLVSSTM